MLRSSLTKFKKHHSLFTHSSRHSSRIAYITDSEGTQSFLKTFQNSNIIHYHPDRGLAFRRTEETPYFIFGGDLTDRGNNDIAITQLLVDFKKRHPENVFLLAGNREITKTRFKIELAPELIRQRLLNSQIPRWLTHQPTVPLDYVKAAMAHDYYGPSAGHTNVKYYVDSLSDTQCQLIYLKWMLEKTMGCPHTFRYRREELKRIKQTDQISDQEVLQSFMHEASPQGITGQYLKLAQVGVIVPGTRVLAIHGGLQPTNIGRLPGMTENDGSITDVRIWIDQFNQWYNHQIQHWISYRPTQLTIPACTDLDECSLPIANKPKSIITADMLNKNRQFIPIPDEIIDYLQTNGNDIQLVLTGHQPCGDHPAILRASSLLFCNGDTGYASFDPANPDDTRGFAHHTLDISASMDFTRVRIQATLSDQAKTAVKTDLTITANEIKGDKHIGKVTADNQLVQCRLPDGDYRLIHQEGIKVKYSVANVAELEAMKLQTPTFSREEDTRESVRYSIRN